jgi:hypothetical protein
MECFNAGYKMIMNKKSRLQNFCLLFFLCCSFLMSQEVERHHPWWVNVGAGPSLIGSDFAMNAGIIYCYQFESSLISARIIGMTNKNPTIQRIDETGAYYKMTDYGILYGPLWQEGDVYISLGAGIGLVRVAYENNENYRTYKDIPPETNTSISLPLEAQWFWRPTYFAGIGVYFSTTMNFEKQLTSALICVQLGVW